MMIILMAGLPGTGKSTLAAELARRLDGTVVSKDTIRHLLFQPSQIAYDQEQDDFCAEVGFGVASQLLRLDPAAVIIFDGRTCTRAYQVRRAQNFAADINQGIQIIECVCSEKIACSRLKRDAAARRHPAANRDSTLYFALRSRATPVPSPKLVIPTDGELSVCADRCIRHLSEVYSRPLPIGVPHETRPP